MAQESIDIYDALGMRNSIPCATALQGLGSVLLDLGRQQEAMHKFEESVVTYKIIGLGESIPCASAVMMLKEIKMLDKAGG